MARYGFYLSGLPTAMIFIPFHSLFYLPGILPFLFRRFRPFSHATFWELFYCENTRQSQPLPMPASRRRGEP